METHSEEGTQEQTNTMSAPEPTAARINPLATIAVGLVMLAIGIAAGYFGRPLVTPEPLEAMPVASVDPAEPSAAADAANAAALMDAVMAETRHFKGDPDAPVTIVEFSDFQCPYCGRFAADAGRQIHEQYVETGLVRFGYQHFAFLGPESQKAAEASECAAEQGAFWPYHDKLFGRMTGKTRGL